MSAAACRRQPKPPLKLVGGLVKVADSDDQVIDTQQHLSIVADPWLAFRARAIPPRRPGSGRYAGRLGLGCIGS